MKKLQARKIALILLFLFSRCIAQTFETPQEKVEYAFKIYYLGQPVYAVELLKEVAEEHRGTEPGYTALEFLAGYVPEEQSRIYIDHIIHDFPDSVRQTKAEMLRISYDFDQSPDKAGLLQAYETLATDLGGPGLGQILEDGESAEIAKQIRELDEVTQRRLLEIYPLFLDQAAGDLPWVPDDVADPEVELKFLQFLHRVFTPLDLGYEGLIPITRKRYSIAQRNSLSATGREPADPTVIFVDLNSGSPTGPLPTISATLKTGDYRRPQVALERLTATLDGIDVKPQLNFATSFGEAAEGVDFLTVSVSFTPAQPLTEGAHQFVLDVPVSGYPGEGPGRTVATLNFTVTTNPSGPTTLETTKDTTLRAQKPHRNEGANPRLFLSHRLEARGKSNNPLVGFSLADADLNGLTKATLVLNIQDCDLPRRWSRTGRDIEAHAVTADWVEGDGNKYRVNGGQGKTKGRGQGVTWFSPVDEKIQNNRPNGSQSWDGARSVSTAPTAPPVTVMNDQTGPIEFDVTTDVLRTASLGDGFSEISWLLKKSDEGKFGNVRFYSKEGAAQAGDPDLAPTLILEYGSPISKAETKEPSSQASQLLSKIGIKSGLAKLKTRSGGSELPSLRQSLKRSAAMSQVCESTLSQLAGPNPAIKIVARTAYRSWLHQTVTLG